MKKFFLPGFILILISVNGFCQNGKTINLKFNLPKGSGYDYNADVNISMKGTAAGQPMDTNKMAMGYRFSVVDDSSGWKKLSTTVARIAMKMNIGAINLDYDSNKPVDTSDAMNVIISKVFEAMKGATFMFTMNEKGEIGSITGIDEIKSKILSSVPSNDAMANGASNVFNEDDFKQNMQQAFGFYPGKPVKIGDAWNSTTNTTSGGMQMKLYNTYTLESVNNNIASIKVDSKTSSGAGMPLTGTMTGTMQYDISTGIPVSGNLDMLVNITVDTDRQSTSLNMDIKTIITGKKY